MPSDPRRLTAIMRLHADGLSYTEIGTALGISRQRAHQLHQLAKRKATEAIADAAEPAPCIAEKMGDVAYDIHRNAQEMDK